MWWQYFSKWFWFWRFYSVKRMVSTYCILISEMLRSLNWLTMLCLGKLPLSPWTASHSPYAPGTVFLLEEWFLQWGRRLAAAPSPKNLLEMQILSPYPTESETLPIGPSKLFLFKQASWAILMHTKFEGLSVCKIHEGKNHICLPTIVSPAPIWEGKGMVPGMD